MMHVLDYLVRMIFVNMSLFCVKFFSLCKSKGNSKHPVYGSVSMRCDFDSVVRRQARVDTYPKVCV